MAHGTPDWGHVGPKSTTYGLDDLGEHAVRLGSPHRFDRRGDLLASTDFRDGFGEFVRYNTVVGGNTGLCTGHSRQGAYSIILTSAGTNAGQQGGHIVVPYTVPSRIGGEFTFSVQVDADPWLLQLYWVDRTTVWQARLRYTPATGQLWYYNAGGGDTPFAAGVWTFPTGYLRHTMKLVVDMATHQYVRAIFNELPYSLAGILVRNAGGGAYTDIDMWALLERAVGSDLDMYIDNVIVTQNEPT